MAGLDSAARCDEAAWKAAWVAREVPALQWTMTQTLDKYARDWALWRSFATINCSAAIHLFDSGDPMLLFPAATLGHHALEMHLKSVLILNGMTACDPRKVKHLDPSIGLTESDCVWGHELVKLGTLLATTTPHFKMDMDLPFIGLLTEPEPITVERGLAIFDPFFTELRYPQEAKLVNDLGPEHKILLEMLVKAIQHARGMCRVAGLP
jgi:hypothetical protein